MPLGFSRLHPDEVGDAVDEDARLAGSGPASTSTLVCSRSSRTICSWTGLPSASTIAFQDLPVVCRRISTRGPRIQRFRNASRSMTK